MTTTFTLSGGSPWGFRLVGGQDFRTSLAISKVTPGGKADRAGIKPGMVIISMNGSQTKGMTHLEALNKVKSASATLSITIETNGGNSSNVKETVVQTYDPSPATQRTSPPATQVSSVSFKPKQWQPSSASAPANPPPPVASQSEPVDDFLPPPPPPQDLLLAELHQDTSQDDPICEGCRKVIRGPYLTHQGKNWHPEEFLCAASNCRKLLQNVGFIEEKGQRYCKDCYEKHFAHTCGKCHKKIVGEVMHALNQTWHMTCFVCTACNQTFKEGVFQMQDDKPYCIADFNRLFSHTCKGCTFPIEAGDHYLEALSGQWHDTCFNCAVCHCDLKNTGFFSAGGKPVCANHKNARIA